MIETLFSVKYTVVLSGENFILTETVLLTSTFAFLCIILNKSIVSVAEIYFFLVETDI